MEYLLEWNIFKNIKDIIKPTEEVIASVEDVVDDINKSLISIRDMDGYDVKVSFLRDVPTLNKGAVDFLKRETEISVKLTLDDVELTEEVKGDLLSLCDYTCNKYKVISCRIFYVGYENKRVSTYYGYRNFKVESKAIEVMSDDFINLGDNILNVIIVFKL